LNPLYLLVVLTTFGHIVQVGAKLAVMLYGVHLGASAATVGILAALFNIVSVFTSLYVGRWIDRSGARVPMLLGAGMSMIGAAIGFLWESLAGLFLVSLVIGSFYNLTFISQQRLAGQYGRPEDRVRNFSFTSLAQSVGGTLGPVLAGFAIDHAGHPQTFMMFTAIAALPFVVLALGLLEYPPKAPPRKPSAQRPVGMLALIRGREIRNIYMVSIITSSTWSVVSFLIPLYGTQIGLDASTIGAIIGAFSLATIVIRVGLSWLSRRMTHWQLIIASLVVTAVACMAIPFFTAVWLLMTLAAWIGIGLGLSGPISQAIVYDASPPDRIGELLGLRVTLLNSSHAVMPILSGAAGAAIGVGVVFWIVAGCLFGGTWVIRDEWRKPRPARATR
jgi:MFS family permease